MQVQLYGNQVWVHRQAVDFRQSIDGLSALIANKLQYNPQQGVFLFFNKNKDKIKLLSWHKNGYILCYKRLEKGRFIFDFNKKQGAFEISMEQLSWALAGLEWQKMSNWQDLSYQRFS